MDEPQRSTLWRIVEGVAITAVLAAAALTWQTREEAKSMQVQLSALCTTLPAMQTKIDRMELELQQSKLTDTSMQGRMFFLEKSLETFEKRIERIMR